MDRIIAILTDFGTSDNYNGVMEGVIRKINKNAKIVYISPEAKNFNIYAGAYLLYTSYKYFSKNTIFLVVIDPGVGTLRKPIIIKTKNYFFVGPDNGVLYPAAKQDGIERIIEIKNEKLYLTKKISNTFHGRDVFAPAAAFLSVGVDLSVFGPSLSEDEINKIEYKTYREGNKICSEIIYIDHFGNIATAIIEFNNHAKISIDNKTFYARRVNTFGESRNKELIIYNNGYGFIEIGINKDDAAAKLNVKEGDRICLEPYLEESFTYF